MLWLVGLFTATLLEAGRAHFDLTLEVIHLEHGSAQLGTGEMMIVTPISAAKSAHAKAPLKGSVFDDLSMRLGNQLSRNVT